MINSATLLDEQFGTLSDLICQHGCERGRHPALIHDDRSINYYALNKMLDRVAVAFQRDAFSPGETVAICAGTSIEYVMVFVGALRAGLVPVPLAPSSTGDALDAMLNDSGAGIIFLDSSTAINLKVSRADRSIRRISLDEAGGGRSFEGWLADEGVVPERVSIRPDDAFNIIYSSGTTGTPKGIVQSHTMRWSHIRRGRVSGYASDAVTIVSTPFYSNTTLVSAIPALAYGGTLVLMAKFQPTRFLTLAERHRVTHAMLVPVQYQRLMALDAFGDFDLTSFRMKTCTSAPFSSTLKADILRRWPGGLVEIYGMTEGGGTLTLAAHLHPDKLHTVGKPVEGHIIRLLDDSGNEVPPGEAGEVVGHSPAMMIGYHNRAAQTREAEWFDAERRRYIRTGDVGRFDQDGFLTLLDRKKDMIISGGFNIFPSDLEHVLLLHPDIAETAVVGVPSIEWGETPVAYVVPEVGPPLDADSIRTWVNAQVGKTQRLHKVIVVDDLPRNAIGKVLKRDLRDRFMMHGSA